MLTSLLAARSIAVVGASRDRRAVGRRILDALVRGPFQGPVYAIKAEGDPGEVVDLTDPDLGAAERIVRGALRDKGESWLRVSEARAVIAGPGVPLNLGQVVDSAEEACSIAEEIGYPVALSVAPTDIVHRSDQGGMHLDLTSAEARDPSFGPLVGFGVGGTLVEVLDDAALRLAPCTDRDAREQVRSIRGWAIVPGHRGRPAADVEAIEEAAQRLSALSVTVDEIVEIDLNPLFARPDGAVATDVRIAVRRP